MKELKDPPDTPRPWKKVKSHDVPSVRGKTELVNCKVKKFYNESGIKLDLYSFIVSVSLEAGLISRSPTMSTRLKMLQSTNIFAICMFFGAS